MEVKSDILELLNRKIEYLRWSKNTKYDLRMDIYLELLEVMASGQQMDRARFMKIWYKWEKRYQRRWAREIPVDVERFN